MRSILFIVVCLSSIAVSAQDEVKTNGIFYKASLGSTFTINEDYELFNEFDDPFIVPSAFLVTNTIGYQFDVRSTIGLNVEYDWHQQQNFQFFPVHLSFRYNVITNDDNIFIRGSYGRLVGLNRNFEKGTLYKVGIGTQVFDENYKNSWLIGLDFNRKRFGEFQTEKLSSVSVFLEFMVF